MDPLTQVHPPLPGEHTTLVAYWSRELDIHISITIQPGTGFSPGPREVNSDKASYRGTQGPTVDVNLTYSQPRVLHTERERYGRGRGRVAES